ncbi:MAG: glucuronate isomerase, partial [Planctomycetota bacterium]
SFQPTAVSDGRAAVALNQVLQSGLSADMAHRDALSKRVFWTLAELCDEFGLPFDLMIGVNRGVYPGGVYQGQDLYDSRVSLIQYRDLFNAFADVKFPISVLASVTNQELVSYAWIFPNVVTNGHWWYSNTPSFIHRDASARLEAVPRNKQVGYYSDAYKLEFVAPKFDMYRRILAKILNEQFVEGQRWDEDAAFQLGYDVLRGNVESLFPKPEANVEPEGSISDNPASQSTDSEITSGDNDGALGVAAQAAAATDVGITQVQQAFQGDATSPEEADLLGTSGLANNPAISLADQTVDLKPDSDADVNSLAAPGDSISDLPVAADAEIGSDVTLPAMSPNDGSLDNPIAEADTELLLDSAKAAVPDLSMEEFPKIPSLGVEEILGDDGDSSESLMAFD